MTLVREGHDVSGATAARPSNAQIGQQFFDETLGCLLVFDGTNWLPAGGKGATELVGASPKTLTAADTGKKFITTIADVVFALPATALGLEFTLVNGVLSTGTGLSASPVAADSINNGVDNKDWINTGATDVVGDCVTLVGNGTTGYLTCGGIGIWAAEG